MQAGELWWNGKETALSTKLDKMAPSFLTEPIFSIFSHPDISEQGQRHGPGYRVGRFQDIDDIIVYFNQWKICMETAIAATESADRAKDALTNLKTVLDNFKSTVKNDLVSMKAASERVQNEVLQMQNKYKQAQAILTTPEFMQAIENAERMAVALKSIQELTETKVSVAVFSGGKQ